MVNVLLPLAVMCNGLAAGGLMIASLGGAPLLLRLPTDQYIPVHQFLVTRFDPFMPINLCSALILDVALVLIAPTVGVSALTAVAAVSLLSAMVVTLRKNVPINRWIRTLSPDQVPADWERLDPRVRWRNWNVVRTALVVAALVINTLTVAVVL